MEEKTKIFVSTLRSGHRVRLKEDYAQIHEKLDYDPTVDKGGYNRMGWNDTMHDAAGHEVRVRTMYKDVFAFDSDILQRGINWMTYYDCIDTNIKPR